MSSSRATTRLAAGALIALLGLQALAAAEPKKERKKVSSRKIAPGLTLTYIRDPKGPFKIRVLTINPRRAPTIDVALAQDQLPGLETTSSMARRHGAIAAINGDYALESGRPVFAFAEDGRLAQTPLNWGRNFSIDQQENFAYIDHPEVSVWAEVVDAGQITPINRVNEGPPVDDEVALFTEEGAYLERPPRYSCSARLTPAEDWHARPDQTGADALHVVHETACTEGRMPRQGGAVISSPLLGPRSSEISSLQPGQHVRLGWSLGWPGVVDTIGGNPKLVTNGHVSIEEIQGDPFFSRHPRTGVGATSDGRILMVTVDGRQRGYSVGMTLRELARLFISLGADSALNLDGGGSTTMVVEGQVKGRPSDGRERAVSSALLVLLGPDPEETPGTAEDSKLEFPRSQTAAVWDLIVADPASTGGLAASMARRHSLSGALRAAALEFLRRSP